MKKMYSLLPWENFIGLQIVISWARRNSYLNWWQRWTLAARPTKKAREKNPLEAAYSYK